VLEKGEIVEIGTHRELIEKKGAYYNMVKDQLELGN
jgi:ATP-binding cassette subfamily B protein